jgi:hypothetical protein
MPWNLPGAKAANSPLLLIMILLEARTARKIMSKIMIRSRKS